MKKIILLLFLNIGFTLAQAQNYKHLGGWTIEAAHLIDVREIYHIGGIMKLRIK